MEREPVQTVNKVQEVADQVVMLAMQDHRLSFTECLVMVQMLLNVDLTAEEQADVWRIYKGDEE